MSLWKQLAISLALLAVAAFVAIRFVPGAAEFVARTGIDIGQAAPEEQAAAPRERGGGGGGGFGPQGGVTVAVVDTATINDRLQAIGTGRAFRTVVVTPTTSGRLVELAAQSGTRIEAGDVIARLDSETQEIAVDRARLALDDARARLQRIEALRASNTATEVQLTEVQLAARNAELALRDAELALERRSILAPISGIVGILPVSEGNQVTEQTEIATIDDRSRILIDFWVPERFSSMIEVGMPLTATSVARANDTFSGDVSAVDNRIDADSRTLRVQAAIDNTADTLRAGMSFQVMMRFPGDSYPAVDPLAIQWDTDGAFVWQLQEGGAARRTPVRIIQRNTDSVLVTGEFAEGASVVTEGIHNVREGATVRVLDDRRPPEATPTADGQPSAAPVATGS
jgi:RND family efflux transporter MFP subunit